MLPVDVWISKEISGVEFEPNVVKRSLSRMIRYQKKYPGP
jgi:hypothetical protein